MADIVQRCGNIEIIKKWMDVDEHNNFLKNGHIYFAPFRSEGFGLPIVEAMVLGLPAIVSGGGTSADDYINVVSGYKSHDESIGIPPPVYPVLAKEVDCDHEPCYGHKLCVFSPCWDQGGSKGWRCACKKLKEKPKWFEVDRDDLRLQMKRAYEDVSNYKRYQMGMAPELSEDITGNKGVKTFCWSELASLYENRIHATVKSPMARTRPPPYIFVNPKEWKYYRKIRICSWILFVIVLLGLLAIVIHARRKKVDVFGRIKNSCVVKVFIRSCSYRRKLGIFKLSERKFGGIKLRGMKFSKAHMSKKE